MASPDPDPRVDPLSRRQFWTLIDDIRAGRPSMSVVIATAYMDEAQKWDFIVAMDAGRAPERVCDAHHANELTNFGCGCRPTGSGSRFPAPVSPKAGTVPTDHGIGFDDLQRIQNAGNQRVEAGEHQSVDPGRGDALRGITAQHIQLVPKYKDLGLQRCARPEQPDESAPDQLAEIGHWP